jgi:hypothetical protein
MSRISPELIPYLIVGILVIAVVGTYCLIMRLHATSRQVQHVLPQQHPVSQTEFETIVSKLADTVRDALSQAETFDMLRLIAAMAGYGPLAGSAKHSRVRISTSATEVMSPGVYDMFVSAFRKAASIPEDNTADTRRLDKVTGYPLEYLITRDEVLAVMVMYCPGITDFYNKNAADNSSFTSAFIVGHATMTGVLTKIDSIFRTTYFQEA